MLFEIVLWILISTCATLLWDPLYWLTAPTEPSVSTGGLYDRYDYIIVGGGSAGCVLANRLSADPSTKVLLIEAGGMEKHYVNLLLYPRVPIDTQIPLFAPLIIGSEVDWKDYPEPQSQACLAMENQVCRLARGKGLGGS
ncbi:hypothetical protein MRX96_035743 [Rhipicephalus microplus]